MKQQYLNLSNNVCSNNLKIMSDANGGTVDNNLNTIDIMSHTQNHENLLIHNPNLHGKLISNNDEMNKIGIVLGNRQCETKVDHKNMNRKRTLVPCMGTAKEYVPDIICENENYDRFKNLMSYNKKFLKNSTFQCSGIARRISLR